MSSKRIKKIRKCPNPLFVSWLDEWHQQARDKGLQSQYTYSKALTSLRKYPLQLDSGKQAKILDGFGDKICKMLDDKLEQHIAVHGCISDVSLESRNEILQQVHKPRVSACVQRPSLSLSSDDTDFVEKTDKKNSENSAQKKPTKRKQFSEYIPRYKSGAHAILLTLYKERQNPDGVGWMTKQALQREAQPLSETSFTKPEPGSHYTAWSSMGSLIQKGYVIKESSPARYSLTLEGVTLAEKVLTVTPVDTVDSAPVSSKCSRGENFEDVPLSTLMGKTCTTAAAVSVTESRTFTQSASVVTDATRVSTVMTPMSSDLPIFEKNNSEFCVEENGYFRLVERSASKPVSATISETTTVDNLCNSEKESTSVIQASVSGSTQSSFTLHPGNFDIVLCVDTGETKPEHRHVNRNDNIFTELRSNE